MMNTYNGNAVLDAMGEAWVGLPEYLEALDEDFRYQLTAIGAPGPNLYVADKVSNHRFRIAGGTPGLEVSWQITGIRKDPWAVANRLVPEVEKAGAEQGRYLHPELYGRPPESATGWKMARAQPAPAVTEQPHGVKALEAELMRRAKTHLSSSRTRAAHPAGGK